VPKYQFSITEQKNLKEEGLLLAHGFRDFSLWLLGSITFELVHGKTSWC
jgi:hypothetical protein